MVKLVSKSEAKARALELFRLVERTGVEVVVTHRGRPVVRIVPVAPLGERRAALRGTVVRYEMPEEPVDTAAWEALS